MKYVKVYVIHKEGLYEMEIQLVMSLHEYQHQNGLLLACGLVAGAALMGVILAIPFVVMGSSNALAIMPHSLHQVATILGFLSLLAICRWLYRTSF